MEWQNVRNRVLGIQLGGRMEPELHCWLTQKAFKSLGEEHSRVTAMGKRNRLKVGRG